MQTRLDIILETVSQILSESRMGKRQTRLFDPEKKTPPVRGTGEKPVKTPPQGVRKAPAPPKR